MVPGQVSDRAPDDASDAGLIDTTLSHGASVTLQPHFTMWSLAVAALRLHKPSRLGCTRAAQPVQHSLPAARRPGSSCIAICAIDILNMPIPAPYCDAAGQDEQQRTFIGRHWILTGSVCDIYTQLTVYSVNTADFQRMADLTIGEMWKKIDQFVDSKPDLKGRTMVQLTQGALPCRGGSSLCLSECFWTLVHDAFVP